GVTGGVLGLMKKFCVGVVLGVMVSVPTFADDAVSFGNFLGVVLAIEEACPQYYVLTDATTGGDLDGKEYQYAMSLVEQSKERAASSIAVLGCDDAAREAVKMVD